MFEEESRGRGHSILPLPQPGNITLLGWLESCHYWLIDWLIDFFSFLGGLFCVLFCQLCAFCSSTAKSSLVWLVRNTYWSVLLLYMVTLTVLCVTVVYGIVYPLCVTVIFGIPPQVYLCKSIVPLLLLEIMHHWSLHYCYEPAEENSKP